MIVTSLFLVLIGMFILYECSDKRLSKSPYRHQINSFRFILRLAAFCVFLIAGALLCWEYGRSIGFISWWIFATPITFFLILWVNPLKQNKKRESS
ncbi:DUF1634 domain-containing protein [Acinetobacter haemolyticus]|uniref:DUF1634 domain-containing protein n=1 Tax=Acinetobacter haemolyticus TaxID=29430 RepID=UPI000D68FBEE|nr:DUF1634 domain-containing protein [Acinetobacter haemolyticus]